MNTYDKGDSISRIKNWIRFFQIIIFVTLFILIEIALIGRCYSNKKIKAVDYNPNDISLKITSDEFMDGNSCLTDLRNKSGVTGNAVIRYKGKSSVPSMVVMYLYNGDSFDAPNYSTNAFFYNGEEYGVFEINPNAITGISIADGIGQNVESIEFHKNPILYKYKSIPTDYFGIFVSTVFNCIVFLILIFIDQKKKFTENLITNICVNAKRIIKTGWIILVDAFLSFLIFYAIKEIKGYGAFNQYIYIYILGILLVIETFIFLRRLISDKPEYVYLCLILICGLTFIFGSRYGHAGWDVNMHYDAALNNSYSNNAYYTKTDVYFSTARYETYVKNSLEENNSTIKGLNDEYTDLVYCKKASFDLSRFPAALAMSFGRTVGMPFDVIFYAMEIINLLIYAFLTFYAIKILKSGKYILAMLSLAPTNILVASTISYDYWVNGFIYLGIAILVSECQKSKKTISYKPLLGALLAITLGILPKQVYFPLLLIPFFFYIKDKNSGFIKDKKRWIYYAVCCIPIIVVIISLLTRVGSTSGDMRGGSNVSMSGQLQFLMNNKAQGFNILFNNFRNFISIGYLKNGFASFGHLTEEHYFAELLVIIFIITCILDRNEYDKCRYNNGMLRGYLILMYYGLIALIELAFYLVFTQVGEGTVFGIQPRYILAFIYPVAAMVPSPNVRIMFNKKILIYAGLVADVLSFFTLLFMSSTKILLG